ncbi:MAG: helix-turn-helix transcriptional regulator [Acidimicrobiales bacterium]
MGTSGRNQGAGERRRRDAIIVNGVEGKRLVAPALVGRAEELEGLVSALSAPPAVVVVEGEAGIGKTRLVAELAVRPEVRDRRLVVGCCRRIREPFPLGPVIDAVRGLGDDLVAATLSPVAGALRPLAPEVADLLPPQPEVLDDRAAERYRVFRGLVAVFESLGPVVLVLEDLHWADEQTVDFVSYLLAEPPPQLSVVLTFRGEEVDPGVRALTAKLSGSIGRTHIGLAALDERQTGSLAAAILGVDRVSEEFAAYLCDRTSGLPFAIEELLALLRARGTLVRRGAGWARKALDDLDVPTGVRDSVLERVSRLSDNARSVVEAAAVLQVPVPVSVLIATCPSPSESATRGLAEALESGLFAEYGEAVGFRHALAAQAVYEEIPRLRRRSLHGRAASTVEPLCPVPLGQLAHHLRHAGRIDEWVHAAETAADQAAALGHDDEAVRFLEDVLRHAPLTPEHRGRIAVKVGQAAVETLHGRDVIGLLSNVLDHDLPRAVRGELRFRLGLLVDQVGDDPVLPRQLYAESVEEFDDRPDLKAWATVALGIPTTVGVPCSEHKMWLERSLEILPTVGDPAFEIFLLGKVAMALALMGDPEWRRLAERIEDQTAGMPHHRREVNAYHSVGMEACFAGHHEVADRLLRAGLKGAVACESRRLELSIRSAVALLDYCRGSWDGLGDGVEVLLDEIADYPRLGVDLELVAGCLALAHGDVDDAQRRLAGVVQRVEEVSGFDVISVAAIALIRLAMARGEVEATLASVGRLLAEAESKGLWASSARALPAVIEAMVGAGQVSEARRLVGRYARELRDLDAPLAPAALRHARGFLAAAADRWPTAARQFLAAADLYAARLCPYEAAQAREQAAISLFASGNAQAIETLRAALATYHRLGATWDGARAARTARRHGVPLPARHRGGRRGYGLALSPREREVAELAALGRTNNEIGAELFVSASTVKQHVAAAMRKLGARSRTALAHRLEFDERGAREEQN